MRFAHICHIIFNGAKNRVHRNVIRRVFSNDSEQSSLFMKIVNWWKYYSIECRRKIQKIEFTVKFCKLQKLSSSHKVCSKEIQMKWHEKTVRNNLYAICHLMQMKISLYSKLIKRYQIWFTNQTNHRFTEIEYTHLHICTHILIVRTYTQIHGSAMSFSFEIKKESTIDDTNLMCSNALEIINYGWYLMYYWYCVTVGMAIKWQIAHYKHLLCQVENRFLLLLSIDFQLIHKLTHWHS